MPPREGSKLKAWLLLILLALVWGTSFILIKRGLEWFTPMQVGSVRLATAGLVLLPMAFARMKGLVARDWLLLLISSLVGNFVPVYLFAFAQTNLGSGITGVINSLTPFFVLVAGFLFFRQNLYRREAIGLVIGFLGTSILILAGTGWHLANVNFYAFLVVLATVLYGLNFNLIKFYLKDIRPLTITSVSLLMVGSMSLVILTLDKTFWETVENPDSHLALIYLVILGVANTALALYLFNKLLKMTTTVFASTVTYLIPIVAIGLGLLDQEMLLIGHFVGMLTILAGIFYTNK